MRIPSPPHTAQPPANGDERERIADALHAIPCTGLEYRDWLQIGQALHAAEAEGKLDDGQALWDQWSATDPERYDQRGIERRWRGFRAGGGVSLGTLYHMARQHGWQPRRGTPTGGKPFDPWTRYRKRSGHPRGDTDEDKQKQAQAAQIWAAAQPSTQGPPANSPPGLWLKRFHVWPLGERLPDAMRWLDRSRMGVIPVSQDPRSDAAGALVIGMRRWGDSTIRKVAIVAITHNGDKAADHFYSIDNGERITRDKTTIGRAVGAYGWLMHWPPQDWPEGFKPDLHVVEGAKDGMAVLSGLVTLDWRSEDSSRGLRAWNEARARCPVVAVSQAAITGGGIDPTLWRALVLWPDSDANDAGQQAAESTADQWTRDGYTVQVKRLPAGMDPADYAQKVRLHGYSH